MYRNKKNYNDENKINFENDMKNFKSKQLNGVYDLTIKIESINAIFDEGWNIIETDYGKECNEKYHKNGSVVVTAIGNKNNGKSFILSKFSEKDIPRGFNITTEGLSVIYPRKRPVIILDTKGSESPLLELEDNCYQLRNNEKYWDKENEKYQEIKKKYIEKLKKYEKENKDEIEKINEDFFNSRFDYINKIKQEDLISQIHNYVNEKIITDYFLQRFAIEKSNVILLVFGKMTRQEQFFLNRIKIILNNSNHKFSQKLIVIHNLYNLKKIKDVEKYIEENLKTSDTFSVKEKEMRLISKYVKKDNFFKFFFIEEKNEIIHFIMAEEGTEAGDYFNDTVIEYIKCCITSSTDLTQFDLLEQLKEFFIKFSDKFFFEKLKENDIIIDKKKMKVIEGKKFQIKDFYANFFNFTLGNTKFEFVPKFYEKTENNLYKIIIECPGDSKINEIKVNYYDNITQILINGIKRSNIPDNLIFLGGNKLSSDTFNINKFLALHGKVLDDQDIKVIYKKEGYIECIFKINEK